jgi:hypothetical protein
MRMINKINNAATKTKDSPEKEVKKGKDDTKKKGPGG